MASQRKTNDPAATKPHSAHRKKSASKPMVLVVSLQEKLLLSPAEVIALTGIKRDKLFRLLARGEIESFKDGNRRFIPRSAILAYGERKVAQSRRAA